MLRKHKHYELIKVNDFNLIYFYIINFYTELLHLLCAELSFFILFYSKGLKKGT